MLETQVMEACCCGGVATERLFGAQDLLHGVEGQFSIARCLDCQLIRTVPRPVGSDLARYYPETYHPHTLSDPPARQRVQRLKDLVLTHVKNYPGQRSFKGRLLAGLIHRLTWHRLFFYPQWQGGGRVLDVGCGAGHALGLLQARGWDCVGLDLSPAAVARVRERGIEAHLGTVEEVDLSPRQFQAAILVNSLEHVPDPRQTLLRVHELLVAGGELLIGVPSIAGWIPRLFGPHWFGLDVPRHLYHFTPQTLARLAKQCGFEVLELRPHQFSEYVAFSWLYRRHRAQGRFLPLTQEGLVPQLVRPLLPLVNCLGGGDSLFLRARAVP